MAGFGWYPGNTGPGLEVSGDGQTATRPTDGGGGSYAAIRGSAGRKKGKRYFEIDAGATCSVGVVDAAADLDGALGGGVSALQWGFLLSDGYLYFNQQGGSGSTNMATGTIAPSVIGILIDFDSHKMTVYADGAELFTQALSFAVDTVLYPAVSLGTGDSATINTQDPFEYPPAVTYVPWDKSDLALGSKVSGTIQIEEAPVARLVKAFSYERLPIAINNDPTYESMPLGQSISDPITGEYEIILRDGFPRAVFVTAFDDYGRDFQADAAIATGERVHPTTPSGYVYECTGAGDLPSTEPDPWPTDTEASHLIGTASFDVKPFYRPQIHGPVVPEAVDVDFDGEMWAPTVSANMYYGTVAILADGTVTGWGLASRGNLTSPPGLNSVVQISNNYWHTLVLRNDGSVVAFGANSDGECDVPTGLEAIAVSTGRNVSFAIRKDGSIAAWGEDDYGLISGAPSGGVFKQVSACQYTAAALRDDGTIVVWGQYLEGVENVPPEATGVVQISVGYAYVLALKADGSVIAWGRNGNGQATPPAITDGVEVSAGWDCSICRRAGGYIEIWGNTNYNRGILPEGLDGDCVHVSSGRDHLTALRSNLSAVSWGGSNYSQSPAPPITCLAPTDPKP